MNEKIYSIDWLRGTSDIMTFNDEGYPDYQGILFFNNLLKVMNINKTYYDYDIEHSGVLGYHKTIFIEDGIKLYFDSKYNINKNGKETICFDITGQGCDFFPTNISWFRLIDFLLANRFKFTKVDLAVDDFYGKEINRVELHKILVEENYIKQGTFEPNLIQKINDPDNTKGYTVNLYSNSSDVQLVIYDKAAERKEKVGYLSETPQWLRYEMRFKSQNAHNFVSQFYVLLFKDDNKAISSMISAKLNSLFRPVVPTGDSNKSRWPTDPRWINFINDISNVEFDRKIVHRSNIDSVKEYIETNYCKAMAKIFLSKNKKYFMTWIKNVALNGIDLLDDELINEINTVRSKSGYNKLSKECIFDIKLINELTKSEKEVLSTWGTNKDIDDVYYSSDEDLLCSLLYDLDLNQLKDGNIVIRSDDHDLVKKIKNYLGLGEEL